MPRKNRQLCLRAGQKAEFILLNRSYCILNTANIDFSCKMMDDMSEVWGEDALGRDRVIKKTACLTAASLLALSVAASAGGLDTDDKVVATQKAKPAAAKSAAPRSTAPAKPAATTSSQTRTSAAGTGTRSVAQAPRQAVQAPTGFEAIEDQQLEIDTSGITDGDGLGSIQIQWQISDNGDQWRSLPGAITPNFTPRDAEVGRFLRAQISYIDGQGNAEMLISPASMAVQNVNDNPVGLPVLLGDARENSILTIDTSRVSDEDGIGALSFAWERARNKADWELVGDNAGRNLRMNQSDVGFSYRVRVSYIDGFGTAETLYTDATEPVANVDNPLEGELVVRGQPTEGNELVVSTSDLRDYDGIASMSIFWETSADGQTWDILSLPANTSRILLSQSLVGLKIRVRANVIDNFGMETVVFSTTSEPVKNVNNKPIGQLLIKKSG